MENTHLKEKRGNAENKSCHSSTGKSALNSVSKQRKFISAVEIQPWILSWILKVHGKILSTPYFRTSVRCFFSLAQGKRGDESSHRSTPAIQKVQVKSERASHTAQLNHHIQRHCYTLPSLAGAWGNELSPFSQAATDFRKVPLERRPVPLSGIQHIFPHWWQIQKVCILHLHHLYIISLPNPLAIFISFSVQMM